jgi:pyruvate/2-oxoglutarate dehydrogenase complex dihydrolipoamide acyltransferase (E2) component
VTVNPGGGSGWDEPPLDIQIPDDARELDRDVLAYRRELRAQRRRNRLKRLAGPLAPFGPSAARGTVMPLLASILAVCLVAGAMLSVATFSPATSPAEQTARPTTTASPARPAATPSRAHATASTATGTARTSPSVTRASRSAGPSASALLTTGPSTGRTRPAVGASASGSPGAPR